MQSLAETTITLADLPKDVLTSIFRHGDFVFLRTVVLVCRRFVKVVKSDHILRKRIALLVFQETNQPVVGTTSPAGKVFPLLTAPAKQWPARRLQLHVKFASLAPGVADGDRLASFINICVFKAEAKQVSNLDLAYFADGDVWCRGDHAKYPGGFGSSSGPARFFHNQTVSMLVDLDVRAYAKQKTIAQDADPTCVVTFYREGTMVHLPFLMKIDLDELRVGVHLPTLCRAEVVSSNH